MVLFLLIDKDIYSFEEDKLGLTDELLNILKGE
jgi:hypothetical protein